MQMQSFNAKPNLGQKLQTPSVRANLSPSSQAFPKA